MKRRLIALTLVFALVASMCTTAFAGSSSEAPGTVAPEGAFVKYVSLGDSMTNGYGLEGYEEPQGDGTIKNWFGFQRNDVKGSYPWKVADHFDWELNQIATSGLRADDVYYLLNLGTDYEVNWDEYGRNFMAEKFEQSYKDAHNGVKGSREQIIAWAAEQYQAAVKAADVISIGIGSNNFATLIDMRMMWWMGKILGDDSMFARGGYSGSFNFGELVGKLTAEERDQIKELYAEIEATMLDAVAESGVDLDTVLAESTDKTVGDFVKDMTNAIAYTSAGFALGYKGTVDTIIRENDDAEIIIVGLTNWFRGMVYGLPVDGKVIEFPMGDLMEDVCTFAGVYMAAIPAYYEAKNGTDMQPIYFADTNAEGVEDVELIVDVIVDNTADVDLKSLDAYELGSDERFEAAKAIAETISSDALPHGTTRARLLEAMGQYVMSMMGMRVPTVADVEAYEAYINGGYTTKTDCNIDVTFGGKVVWTQVYYSEGQNHADTSAYLHDNYGILPSTIALEDYVTEDELNAIYQALREGADPVGTLAPYIEGAIYDAIYNAVYPYYEGCIAYLGLEKSMISSLHLDVVNIEHFEVLSSLTNLMDVTMGALEGHMTADPNDIAGGLIAVPELSTVSNLMFNFLVGSGVIVHPSDAGHTTIADEVIKAYEEKYSAGEETEENLPIYAEKFYNFLAYDDSMSTPEKVDLLGKLYAIVKDNASMEDYPEVAVVEEIYEYLDGEDYINDEQTLDIVLYVYERLLDGKLTNSEIREIAKHVYFDVFAVSQSGALMLLEDSILSATDKLAIVEAVYEIMDKYYDLESTPNLKAIKDLYDVLTDDEGGEPLVSDELALSIIDLAVEALVENETLGEEEIAEVAAEIADKLLAEDSELTREAKAAVLREVTNALKNTDLGETEIGGAVLPALDVIDELRTELKAYLSDEQVGEIIEIVYSFVKENAPLSEKEKAQLADEIYAIVLNREDLTAEDKIEIITIIYTVLDEHDYVDANVTIAYMKAYAAAKEKGYIDDAALALDAVKGIVELAKDYVDVYPGSEELKALLLEELDNTEETLDALIGLLDNEVLDEDAWAEMKALEDELNKHIETITELAEAMGVELDGCIADLEDAAKVYADMIAEVAEAAYDYAVESIEGFADDYAEWVESVGDEIDEVNPILGDAVRKFLTEVPADSLSILYAYGDEAVAKLVSEAVKAYGDMETVIADLAYVLNTYGEEIYEAVKGNDEIEELIEDIQDQLAEVKELVEWINDHPFEGAYNASVADKEAALQAAYDQLVYLYNRLYDVAMSVIADVDEDAAEALEAALDAMSEILSIAGESAEGYLGWLADHGEAMGCALLTALLDNIEELLTTACPIVDELIWALLAQIDQAILEFLLVADQWMYDWLYNNPDKVIAFFTEYGEEIAELAEEYGEYVAGILGYIAYTYGPEVLEYVIENPEEALEQFVAWYEKYGYRVWPMIDVYLEELGVYDAIEDGAEAVIEKIEEALEELGVQLESEIRDLIDEKLDDATHGEYTVSADSYYVAIDEMYGEDEEGYADKLAEHLGIAYTEINELDKDEIAKADLITVRYNNEPMIGVMIEDAKDYKTVEVKDWSVYVGEVGAEYVQQALAEVKAMLAEQDLGTMGDMALVAVESYAYEYVGHMISYIQDLETISEINPDALVISVGMNNALSDVVLTLDEEEIALGEYIQYVVDAANLEAFVYVLVTGNAIYVDAPAVETEFDAEESADVMDFILNLIDEESREVLLATDAGHEYIKEQILGALTITYEGLLGDANSDGVVDYVDAIYVLEYDAKLRTADELAYGLCDVNGDGEVDYVDAIFILEYDAKLITKFPAAV